MTTPRSWSPILDLPDDLRDEHDPELFSLIDQWNSRQQELEHSESLREFNLRLVRRWSIETGILERLYTLDEGVTLTLCEQGFDSAYLSHGDSDIPADRLIAILEDHRQAAEGLFVFVRQGRKLSESYVKELHQQLLGHQTDCEAIDSLGRPVRISVVKGAYKSLPNNPSDRKTQQVVHHYCPPEHVTSEMEQLVAWHAEHFERGVAFDVEAAWLHHRFTQIHPFQDGNGRVARALATLVCLRGGAFPPVIARGEKARYIAALRRADDGDLRPLVELIRTIAKRGLRGAMSLATEVVGDKASQQRILEELRRRLQVVEQQRSVEVQQRIELVRGALIERMNDQRAQLVESLGASNPDLRVDVFKDEQDNRHWFRGQIVQCAKQLGYYADTTEGTRWVNLRVATHATGHTVRLVVSIHPLGRGRTDLFAVSAFVDQIDSTDGREGERPATSTELCCDEPFTFDADWEWDVLSSSFGRWLESSIDRGMRLWLDWL